MNKICGYSCEHNKGGVCQITNCDKKIMMTTTTEPQVFTRWQDPTIEEYKQLIKNWKEKYYQMKEERNKQKELLDKIKEMTKDLHETEYEGIYKDVGNNCCEQFYLLEELNKLLEEI